MCYHLKTITLRPANSYFIHGYDKMSDDHNTNNDHADNSKPKEAKPVTYKIQVKSPQTEYIWKDLPNSFSDEVEATEFNNNIPRHVSHRIVKETSEIIKEHNSENAHYLS